MTLKMEKSYYSIPINLFLAIRAIFPKYPRGHTAQALLTQHFYPSDESTSKVKQINFSTTLSISYILLHSELFSRPTYNTSTLSTIFYALFSFLNGQLSYVQTTFHSIHLLLGLPLMLLLSAKQIQNRYIITNLLFQCFGIIIFFQMAAQVFYRRMQKAFPCKIVTNLLQNSNNSIQICSKTLQICYKNVSTL